jgi:hypothetical protein
VGNGVRGWPGSKSRKKKKKNPKISKYWAKNNSLPVRSGQKRAAIIGKPGKVSQKRGLPKKGGQNWKARRGQPEMGKSNKKISFLISKLWHLNPDTSYLTSPLWHFISDISSLMSVIK